MTPAQADQVKLLQYAGQLSGETTLYRKSRNVLVATEHRHGLWRTVVRPNGATICLCSGPVPQGWIPLTTTR